MKEHVIGECVEIGDYENGQCRVLVFVDKEELKALTTNLLYKKVSVELVASKGFNDYIHDHIKG